MAPMRSGPFGSVDAETGDPRPQPAKAARATPVPARRVRREKAGSAVDLGVMGPPDRAARAVGTTSSCAGRERTRRDLLEGTVTDLAILTPALGRPPLRDPRRAREVWGEG